MSSPGLFQLESDRGVLIITPRLDMGELNCDQIKDAGSVMLAEVDAAPERNLLVDFSQSEYFGSDALGLFLHLWKKASRRGGRIAFCGASGFGDEILRRAKFDHLGLICSSRNEALDSLAS